VRGYTCENRERIYLVTAEFPAGLSTFAIFRIMRVIVFHGLMVKISGLKAIFLNCTRVWDRFVSLAREEGEKWAQKVEAALKSAASL
jgi:hypothetical protein